MKSTTTKRPIGRIIQAGEIDPATAKRTVSLMGLNACKIGAQKLREDLGWKFDNDKKQIYDALIEVIRYIEPDFDTEFTPAI